MSGGTSLERYLGLVPRGAKIQGLARNIMRRGATMSCSGEAYSCDVGGVSLRGGERVIIMILSFKIAQSVSQSGA